METITKKRAVPTVAEITRALREVCGLAAKALEVGTRQDRVDPSRDDTWNALRWATPGSDHGNVADDDNDLVDTVPLADVLAAARKGQLDLPCELDVYVHGIDGGFVRLLENVTIEVTAEGEWRV